MRLGGYSTWADMAELQELGDLPPGHNAPVWIMVTFWPVLMAASLAQDVYERLGRK